MYYLQSRYYDSETGRFINADAQLNHGSGVLGFNTFSYCLNNPVNMIDGTGKSGVATAVASVFANAAQILKAVAVVGAIVVATTVVNKKINQQSKRHTIYTLSDPDTKQVVYVGRTTDYYKRMKAHSLNPSRRNLEPKRIEEGLSYNQARAAEQAYILYYSTLDRTNKAKNQINGINPKRPEYGPMMKNGFGISEALDSILTNEFLSLFE